MTNLSIEELKEMRTYATARHLERFVRVIDEVVAIRELKGDQVPVAYVMCNHAVPDVDFVFADEDSAIGSAEHLNTPDGKDEWTEIPLFTGPQKPVLHPQLLSDIRQCVIDATAWCTHRSPPDYVINVNAWLAVGGIVKVTDKCHPSLMESVTVPHNVIGSYEDASGGRSDIVTLSDKREMKDMSSIVKDGE